MAGQKKSILQNVKYTIKGLYWSKQTKCSSTGDISNKISVWLKHNIHFYNKNICTKTSKEIGSGNKGNVKNITVPYFQYSHKSLLWQTFFEIVQKWNIGSPTHRVPCPSLIVLLFIEHTVFAITTGSRLNKSCTSNLGYQDCQKGTNRQVAHRVSKSLIHYSQVFSALPALTEHGKSIYKEVKSWQAPRITSPNYCKCISNSCDRQVYCRAKMRSARDTRIPD